MTLPDHNRMEMVADMLGLDEFERIAVAEIMRKMSEFPRDAAGLVIHSRENEHLFIELGAVISAKTIKWAGAGE